MKKHVMSGSSITAMVLGALIFVLGFVKDAADNRALQETIDEVVEEKLEARLGKETEKKN